MYKKNFGNDEAPIKVGEELDVKIEGVGEKGDGIARVKGFVIFVPGVKQGDEVHIKVTRVLRKVGFADVAGAAKGKTGRADEPATDEESEEEAKPVRKPYRAEESEDDGQEDVEDTDDFGEE